MKKLLKLSYISIILALTLFISSSGFLLMAEENNSVSNISSEGRISSKEEVVYGSLDQNGKVNDIYVVNILNLASPGIVYDQGSYSLLKNLTDTGELVQENGKIKINASGVRFYYQGNIDDGDLPWIIDITYYLDGSKIDPKMLAGANGHVKIDISTKKNSAIHPSFFENYLLQVTARLDTGKFKNIEADGATYANAGADKILNFTVLPGAEGSLSIEADVNGFEIDGFEFSAIPFSMQISMPDISGFSDQLLALANAISQLSTGISTLEKGLTELNSGSSAIVDGSSGFKEGLSALDSKSNDLIQASYNIMDAIYSLNAMMSIPEVQAANPQLAYALSQLVSNYGAFHSGLEEYTQGVNRLAGSYEKIHSGISGLTTGIVNISGGVKELGTGANALYENTRDLPQAVENFSKELLSEYDKSDYTPLSFVSPENKNVVSVQFVMRTEKIAKEDVKPAKNTDKEPETFWTRLLDLFR